MCAILQKELGRRTVHNTLLLSIQQYLIERLPHKRLAESHSNVLLVGFIDDLQEVHVLEAPYQ